MEAVAEVTSDALVETLSITGTPEECQEKLASFDGVLDHVILHTPYVPPLTPERPRTPTAGSSGPSTGWVAH